MIVSMIRQFGLRLRADPEEIPFQYSSNIQMQFIKDENYNDYTVVGYYIPPGENEAKLLNINNDGTFTLGPDCFKNRGTLSFSFNLVNSIEEVHLGSIDFEVRYSFGDGDTILPEPEEVWISLVTQVAKDAIKDDVALVNQKANEALQSASLANDKASEAQEYANNANQSANSASLSASSALTAKNDAIAALNSAIQAKQDAEQSANNAKNSANTALENANKSTEAIETVTQIKTEIENKANDFDTNYQEKLKSFNDNATEKQNSFNQSVIDANNAFNSKVNQANSDLDTKIQEANATIDEKVTEATNQATKAKEEADRATLATDGKLDKNQGTDNVGKVMVVGEDGELTPTEYKSGSDNKLIGTVAKSSNPNITDGYQAEMMNLKLYGKSTQVTTTGKNLFDIDGNVNTTVNNTQGAKNSVQNGILTSNYNSSNEALGGQLIKIENGKQYTISLNVISIGTGSSAYIAIYRNGEPIYSPNTKVGAWKTTITATGDEILLAFGTNGGVGAKYTNIQVEEGASKTSYEPYSGGQPSPSPQYPQEITAISEFSGQVNNGSEQTQPFTYTPTNPMYSTQDGSISDYVDVEKGVEVYNMKPITFNNTQMSNVAYIGSTTSGYSKFTFRLPYNYVIDRKINTIISCSALEGTQGAWYTDKINIISGDNNSKDAYYANVDGSITTKEDFLALFENDVELVYILETPTETPIDPEQLAMLRALYTYNGVTNFLCNAPVSFDYEQSLQIVIQNIWNAIGQTNANILLGGNQ